MSREQFEVWAEKEHYCLAYADCGYVYSSTEAAWKSWQAASKASEQQLAAVVAENAGLKASVVRIFNYGYQHGHESTVEGNYVDIHRNDISEYHEDIVAEIAEEQTPATDAAIANIQAQGVEMFASSLKVLGSHEHPYSTAAKEFAAQLRQGAAL
ncbi:hypothetical protein [Kluyvera intermedia]|uniref:hypothetical protein n=1 Tax=Kluyvera intermedia TaxID=61648 RepID=UPI00372D2BB5